VRALHPDAYAKGTALLFLKEIWKHHGTPKVVISDRGPQFIAAFTRGLCRLLGIKLVLSMTYHSQTDGQMEHVNQVLEGYLRTFMSQRQDDWDDLLPTGEF
jgi:transposase InsO family protein